MVFILTGIHPGWTTHTPTYVNVLKNNAFLREYKEDHSIQSTFSLTHKKLTGAIKILYVDGFKNTPPTLYILTECIISFTNQYPWYIPIAAWTCEDIYIYIYILSPWHITSHTRHTSCTWECVRFFYKTRKYSWDLRTKVGLNKSQDTTKERKRPIEKKRAGRLKILVSLSKWKHFGVFATTCIVEREWQAQVLPNGRDKHKDNFPFDLSILHQKKNYSHSSLVFLVTLFLSLYKDNRVWVTVNMRTQLPSQFLDQVW